jgi:hypothetical protein
MGQFKAGANPDNWTDRNIRSGYGSGAGGDVGMAISTPVLEMKVPSSTDLGSSTASTTCTIALQAATLATRMVAAGPPVGWTCSVLLLRMICGVSMPRLSALP